MTDGRIARTRLGTDGPEVGRQGLGCMGMSFAYGPSDAQESRATLERAGTGRHALRHGARVRRRGEREVPLPFFKAHRDEVVIATKFGLAIDPDDPTKRIIRNDAAYIRESVEGSLRRPTST